MSLKIKLSILFLVICMIPSLFISVLAFTDYKSSLELNRMQALQDIVVFKSDKIEKVFETLGNDIQMAQSFWNIRANLPQLTSLEHSASDPEFIAANNALNEQLRPMQRILGLDDIMLLSPDGKIVYSSNETHVKREFLNPLPESQQKAFLEGRKKIYFTDIYAEEAKTSEREDMLISAPACDSNGAFIGVIVFDVDMAPIYKLIHEKTGLGSTGETVLVKEIGDKVAYLTPLKYEGKEEFMKTIVFGESVGLPAQNAAKGSSGFGASVDYRGKEVIAAWRYIPSLGWGIVAKIDTQEAFADVYKLRNLVLIILVIVFFLVGITALSVGKSISGPVEKLTRGAEIIGAGNLEHRVGIVTKDEIGQLSRSIDQMAGDLKKAQDKAISSEKLAIVGKLASSVAHELRNPLGVMKNVLYYLDMLGSTKDNPELKENLGIINQEINNSDKIITDLLEFSRAKESVFHPENIGAIIKEVLNRLTIPINIELALELNADLAEIEVDALQIHQVFYNIAKNALEAMEKGGRLKIKTELARDGFIDVVFSDTGSGIARDNIANIFEPLFSTKTKGTGLGLSVCSSIIERHGGKIEVDSTIGKGATFIVKLPVKRG